MKTGLVLLHIHTTKVCQAIFYYLMNTYNILFVHLAIKSLSTGEATAIVLCCSAFLVGIMITLIILLTVGFISKKKQLQAVQTPNRAHIIQDDHIATSNANLRQETQAMFHCTQNDEVNLNPKWYYIQSGYAIQTTGLWLYSLYNRLRPYYRRQCKYK